MDGVKVKVRNFKLSRVVVSPQELLFNVLAVGPEAAGTPKDPDLVKTVELEFDATEPTGTEDSLPNIPAKLYDKIVCE
ncbi:MAG: hypothetical protein IPH28_16235 [Cytophagaceae bacterium]|nr:hypothetical protein [Cytophagaceae bacterium]MBL0300494.1 hypothetical protein [Cytophagaceae bacterium]MBL0327428.1 hypothetical protein [Cytophagaceae bacterium]